MLNELHIENGGGLQVPRGDVVSPGARQWRPQGREAPARRKARQPRTRLVIGRCDRHSVQFHIDSSTLFCFAILTTSRSRRLFR